jgi:hypothetical protein
MVAAIVVPLLSIGSVLFLRGRVEGGGETLSAGLPIALAALAAASIPFAVEGHFGILGTSFNPDMSQHLLATDRLVHGEGGQLLSQGYPLGPHAVVVALNASLGIGLVQGFSGFAIAVAVIASLTALAAFEGQSPLRRTAGALLVGTTYLAASYFAQGAFKEMTQALLVLAFALALREASREPWRDLPLRFVPAAIVAVGSVYAYSFPGLIWLVAALLVWLALERPAAARPLLLALAVFLVATLPELGRMLDFRRFETFDPSGPGLGNLFGQISPLEALGIWPSGDFRVAPGDGAAPAVLYYLGAAFAAVLLVYGLLWCWRRRETAILATLLGAVAVYVAARAGGTPYTASKALEIAAPLIALAIVLPLLSRGKGEQKLGEKRLPAVAVALYILAAGGCSLLALANAPVGPTSYSPALTGLRPLLERDSTLVLASERLLGEEHGTPYLAWELRGGRVCIQAEGEAPDVPRGVRFVVVRRVPEQPPFPWLRVRRIAPPYVLWEKTAPVRGASPCPLIAVRQARQGPGG